MHPDAQYWVERLGLVPHPEGGWYRERFRSVDRVRVTTSDRSHGERAALTSIFFLLEGSVVSKFHRLKSDELWYHHTGGVVRLICIDRGGKLREIRLGSIRWTDVTPQAAIPAGTWLGAMLESSHEWALVGCAVAPGFEFEDFELGRRSTLLEQYPQHREWIELLTAPD